MMEIINYKLKIKNWQSIVVFFIFNFSFLVFNSASAQQPSLVKKSDNIETIDGKKFYIHSVEKGQTLYSIAKAYGTTVDVVLHENPDAIDGLKSGDKLKIPYTGNVDAVKKEIEKKEKKEIKGEKKVDVLPLPEGMDTKIKDSSNTSSQLPAPPPVKPIGDSHIALFLPLSLGTVDNIDVGRIAQGDENLPEETKIGIEFYEGIKLAFDSLKKTGFKGSLHVYDTSIDSAGFAKLLKKPEMKDMDLIIGPLYGKRFDAALKFAKENNINIVSPALQGNNMLLGNPNVSKIIPSYVTQAEELAKYIAEKYAGQNIIVFNSANGKDKPYINTFKRTINSLLLQAKADTVKEVTFTTLNNFLVHASTATNKELKTIKIITAKPNIVVIPSTNQSFVTEAINKLFLLRQEKGDSIIAAGMSNFEDIESLDFSYLDALHAIISSYEFVDYTSPQTKKFILNYRHEYKTDPTQYVFAGFDAGMYYLDGLQKYGNELQYKLPEIKYKGLQTEFNFSQSDITSGYENKGVGIMKFENYSFIRVK